MSKTEIITRVPRVGERVEVHREDWGDAGHQLIVGTQAVVTKAEYVEEWGDFEFEVQITGKFGLSGASDSGGWGILAEYGVKGSDYYNGKSTLDAFWSVFQSLDMEGKRRYMRWGIAKGPKGEPKWSDPARQGRYTYDSYDECKQVIEDMVKNSSEDTLRQIHGDDFGTWRPALWEVWSESNHDPRGVITDTLGMDL